MSKKNRLCACGRTFTPIDSQDKICPQCRKYRPLLYETDVYKFERGRMKYNREYGTHYTYGQFVLFLENIERKRKGELEKRSRMRFKKL